MLRPDLDLAVRAEQAVDWLHQKTGVPTADGIVPLVDFVESVPTELVSNLFYEEVRGLTHGTAAAVLRTLTTVVPPLPERPDDPLDGIFVAWPSAPGSAGVNVCVLVNCDHRNPVERRRFTVAHELGHLVFHVLYRDLSRAVSGPAPTRFTEGVAFSDSDDEYEGEPQADVDEDDLALGPADVAAMEREADAFAAALLMPAASCRRLADLYRPQYGDRRAVLARRMAADLLVSRTAMRKRLHTLDLGVSDD